MQFLEIGKLNGRLSSCQFCKDLLRVKVVVGLYVEETDDAKKLELAECAFVDCFEIAEELRERDSDRLEEFLEFDEKKLC